MHRPVLQKLQSHNALSPSMIATQHAASLLSTASSKDHCYNHRAPGHWSLACPYAVTRKSSKLYKYRIIYQYDSENDSEMPVAHVHICTVMEVQCINYRTKQAQHKPCFQQLQQHPLRWAPSATRRILLSNALNALNPRDFR